MPTVTSPVATDETLQATNTALGNLAKDSTLQTQNGKMDSIITKLQGIIDALGLDTSVYKASGSKPCAELISSLLVAGNLGNVYNVTDSGTTTADFVEGAGKPINAGDNVAIVDIGTGGSHVYKFDLLAGIVDLSDKADKVSGATSGNFASLDENGNLEDSGHKHSDYLTQHQDISGKADKVSGATNGNLAGLDENGNLTDSGVAKTDIDDMQDELSTDYATVEGNPLNFTTLSAQTAKSTILTCEPIQDLHGYDKPWVGGAGKNLLPMTVDGIKAINTTGTWSGNDYSLNGVTFTILTDSDNNIVGIKANGTANPTASIYIYPTTASNFNGTILNGCPSGGGSSSYKLQLYDATSSTSYDDTGSGVSISATNGDSIRILIGIINGYNAQNKVFYPMLRLSTVSDATFAPYENICPISGRTEIGILGCGKNLFNKDDLESGSIDTSTGTNSPSTTTMRTIGYIPVKSNTSYTISGNGSNGVRFYKYENTTYIGTELISSGTYTTGANENRIRLVSAHFGSIKDVFQLEEGTATDYEPYTKSNDLTISLGQTVYGGTLDVENGVLVVDKGIDTFDGSNDENWVRWENKQKAFRTWTSQNHVQPPDNYSMVEGVKTNELMQDTPSHTFNETNDYSLSLDTTEARISVVINDIVNDVTKLRTWLENNPLQLVYPLATPITIQLTPHQISLLEGVNNISTTGDKITLTYRDGKVATLGDLKEVEKKIPSATAQHNYSTEEQVVGTWIDGKPLYERIVECGSMPSSTVDKTVNHNIANIDKICFAKGFCFDSTNGWGFEVNLTSNSTSSQTSMLVSRTLIILSSMGSDRSSYDATVLIQYTKTTD